MGGGGGGSGGGYAFGNEVFVPELAFALTLGIINEILQVVLKIVCLTSATQWSECQYITMLI